MKALYFLPSNNFTCRPPQTIINDLKLHPKPFKTIYCFYCCSFLLQLCSISIRKLYQEPVENWSYLNLVFSRYFSLDQVPFARDDRSQFCFS
jgi:hypothetical protein